MRIRHAALVWQGFALLLLVACAPYQTTERVSPVSYTQADDALGRNVGMLRRVALLELRWPAPTVCNEQKDGRLAWSTTDQTKGVLVDQKGYEVVDVDLSRKNATLLDEIETWRWPAPAEPRKAGPELGVLMEGLRTRHRIDALFIRLDRTVCPMTDPVQRTFSGIASLGLYELFPPDQMTKTYAVVEAWMFETATGMLVWHNSVDESVNELMDFVAAMTLTRDTKASMSLTDQLLAPLEPAIPRILTR